MSKIELKQFSTDPENRETAINADIDENNEPFNRLSVWVQHPVHNCLLYTSPSPRDHQPSRMPSSA